MGGVFVAPLVTLDHPHQRRFADDRDRGARVACPQDLRQRLRAQASDLFVVGKGEMDGPTGRAFGEGGRHRHRRGNETLHVAGAAPVKPAVAFHHLERVACPVLVGDRHHVRMTRKQDAPGALRADGREKVRLGSGRVAVHLDARRAEPVGEELDHREVAVGRNRRIADKLAQQGAGVIQKVQARHPFTNSLRSTVQKGCAGPLSVIRMVSVVSSPQLSIQSAGMK